MGKNNMRQQRATFYIYIHLNKVWVHKPSIDIKYSSIPLFLTNQFHHHWTCAQMAWNS